MIIGEIQEYFTLKGRIAELREKMKEQEEIIFDYLLESGEEKLYFEHTETEMFVVEKKYTTSEKLDKDGLSIETKIPKADMKTPFDWSMLTKQDKITPKQISTHTHNETETKVAIKRKKRPKRSTEFKNRAPKGQMGLFDDDSAGIEMKSGESMTLNISGDQSSLVKHNEDGTTTEIPSETTYFKEEE